MIAVIIQNLNGSSIYRSHNININPHCMHDPLHHRNLNAFSGCLCRWSVRPRIKTIKNDHKTQSIEKKIWENKGKQKNENYSRET